MGPPKARSLLDDDAEDDHLGGGGLSIRVNDEYAKRFEVSTAAAGVLPWASQS